MPRLAGCATVPPPPPLPPAGREAQIARCDAEIDRAGLGAPPEHLVRWRSTLPPERHQDAWARGRAAPGQATPGLGALRLRSAARAAQRR